MKKLKVLNIKVAAPERSASGEGGDTGNWESGFPLGKKEGV